MSMPPSVDPSHHLSIPSSIVGKSDQTQDVDTEAVSVPQAKMEAFDPSEAHAIHDGINTGARHSEVQEHASTGHFIEVAKPVLSQASSSLSALDKSIVSLRETPSDETSAGSVLHSGVALLTRASMDTQRAFLAIDDIDLSLTGRSLSSSSSTISLESADSVHSLAHSSSSDSLDPHAEQAPHDATSHAHTSGQVSHGATPHSHAETHQAAHGHEEHESPLLEFAENAEKTFKLVATGLRAAEALEKFQEAQEASHASTEHAQETSGKHEISAGQVAGVAISGFETALSGGILVHEGRHLHKLRQERQDVKKQLSEKLAEQTAAHPNSSPTSLKEKISSGLSSLSSLFNKSTPPVAKESDDSPMLDPEVTRLQQRLESLDKSIKEASAKVAISTVSTGIGTAHFGIEIAGLAAKEGLSVAATVAGSGLALGMGVIGLAISTKSIVDNTKTLISAQKDLKTTQDPATREKLEEKITGAKVGISKGALSAAASCLGIAASGMSIAAAVGVAGLTGAIAATGFGALALGAIALGIGISYLIYRNRAAIASFFSKIGQGLGKLAQNFSQMSRVQTDQMKAGLSRKLEATQNTLKQMNERQLISNSIRSTGSDADKRLKEVEQDRAKIQEKQLFTLRAMFTASVNA